MEVLIESLLRKTTISSNILLSSTFQKLMMPSSSEYLMSFPKLSKTRSWNISKCIGSCQEVKVKN